MRWFSKKSALFGLCAVLIIVVLCVRLCARAQGKELEVALTIGEPYENMRKRSSAEMPPEIPNEISFSMPKTDARLHFMDKKY